MEPRSPRDKAPRDDTARETDTGHVRASSQKDPRVYGYGHRAHQPDPGASYAFEPEPGRVLPIDRRRRWHLSG